MLPSKAHQDRERSGVSVWRLFAIRRDLAINDLRKCLFFNPTIGSRFASHHQVFKILRSANGEVVLKLIGRISEENLPELKSLIESERNVSRILLDLKDVTLVDREVVHFLGQCETDKIGLENCPPYIRDWIEGSRKRKSRRTK